MNFLTWGRNPWGQQILTHVSWDLLWASLFAGLMFLVAHGSYMILSYRRRSASEYGNGSLRSALSWGVISSATSSGCVDHEGTR